MNIYSVALFLHIVGTLGLFVALGLEWTGLRQIQNAMAPDQVRGWMLILKSTRKSGFASMLTTVVSGIYMMATLWGAADWLIVSIGSLVLVIALATVLTAPRMAIVGQTLMAGKGTLTETFRHTINQPLLWISVHVRVAIALGIIFLKITRPDFGGSLITIGVAIVLGFASALPALRREQGQEKLAH